VRTFAFRNGELFTVSFDLATESSRYVVATVDLPGLPGPHAEEGSSAVVGSEQIDGKWHWLHLDPLTKQEIGEHMENYGIGPGWHEFRFVTDDEVQP